MLPKVEASLTFIGESTSRKAINSSLSKAIEAIDWKTCTVINWRYVFKMAKKRKKVLLSSFSIILILIFVLGIISHLLPNAKFVGEEIINGSGTVGAK